MATFAECLESLPTFRNDLLRRQSFEQPVNFLGTPLPGISTSPTLAAASVGAIFAVQGAYAAYATPLTNIHATGVGIRQRGQEYDPTENVIKVFVFDKVATAAANIPQATRDGIPVDVESMPIQRVRVGKSGKQRARVGNAERGARKRTRRTSTTGPEVQRTTAAAAVAETSADATPQRDRRRPVVAGLSISPLNANYVGTLGCFLLKRNVDTEEVFVLSNNHVLANVDLLQVGTLIVQPGPEVPPFLTDVNDAFATLHTVVPITFPTGADNPPVFNRFDAAIAHVTNGDLIKRGHMFGLPQSDTPVYDPTRVPTPVPGMRVMKMGRTTGFTRGRIAATNIQGVQVNYGTPQFPRIAVFQNVIRIIGDDRKPFSLPGDSGAVILEEATGHPVALLFAGDGVRTTACDLGTLCQQLSAWPI